MSIIIADNPITKRDLTILRDKTTGEERFRTALERIAYSLSIEIAKTFELEKFEVETPLEKTDGFRLKKQVVLVPILRAGLSMLDAFLKMVPSAKVGHIGLQRDEQTLLPVDYYFKTPRALDEASVVLLDPMLATGGSASAAIQYLKDKGAYDITLASIIAAPQGVARIEKDHPDVKIFTASVDRGLNEKAYIVPGLGDAGDRNYGTL